MNFLQLWYPVRAWQIDDGAVWRKEKRLKREGQNSCRKLTRILMLTMHILAQGPARAIPLKTVDLMDVQAPTSGPPITVRSGALLGSIAAPSVRREPHTLSLSFISFVEARAAEVGMHLGTLANFSWRLVGGYLYKACRPPRLYGTPEDDSGLNSRVNVTSTCSLRLPQREIHITYLGEQDRQIAPGTCR